MNQKTKQTLYRFLGCLAIAMSTIDISVAQAQLNVPHPTSVISVPNAPVTLTKCKVLTDAPGVGTAGAVNLHNRTTAFLESADVRWTFFNHSGEKMGQFVHTYRLQDHLASGDDQLLNGALGFDSMNLTDSIGSLEKASCRIEAAAFEGNRSWSFGHAWRGKLSQLRPGR